MNINLGAIPLSVDILEKANIGLWAFELDAGKEPRMYVDDVMLGLIGLKEQTTPEKTYHAWYDRIDPDHYDEIAAAVEEMTAGIHAEVQYPWHHPDGRTMIVRCGGVRNPAYTAGVRIEGVHMNVTEVLHFEKLDQKLAETAEQLMHSQFRADVLAYFADNEGDPIEFLRAFADRLRVMLGCDQIIYRDLSEVKVMVNSPEIEKTWAVPIDYCLQCQHLDPFHPMYRNGVTEMADCSKGFEGIPTYSKCPIKSSLTRIVYVNGEVGGFIAIHYVVNYHRFTQLERDTLQDFTKVFSLSLSRYEARNKNMDVENIRKDCESDGYRLAMALISESDAPTVSSNITTDAVCIVYILKKYGPAGLTEFYTVKNGTAEGAEACAQACLETARLAKIEF